METKNTPKVTVKRLAYIGGMLSKYAHRWNPGPEHHPHEPSRRMYDWTDEYNDCKENNRAVWEEYCKTHHRSLNHDAYDMMA
jgi:hypothetical protein